MKKFSLSLCIIMLFTGSVFSQPLVHSASGIPVTKPVITPHKVDAGAKTLFNDTVAYVWKKFISAGSFYVDNTGGTILGASQCFGCPQNITVHGFTFYADAYDVASIDVTCELYAASASKLPTGSPLASVTVTVDSLNSNGLKCTAIFPTPVVMSSPYCVVVSNSSFSSIVLISSANGNGQGQNLSGCTTGSWATMMSWSYNIDWLMFPIVSYELSDVSFTKSASCISNGNNVAFDMTAPSIYFDSMYCEAAYQDSAKYQFLWNFGDGTPSVNALDTNHTYALAGNYDITLYNSFIGWYYYLTNDTTDSIDACVGIGEYQANAPSVYPNPADNKLIITGADHSIIEIHSYTGALLKRIGQANREEILDLSDLANGCYVIRIIDGDKSTTRKISVLH